MTDSETGDGREPARAARSELLELPAALPEPVPVLRLRKPSAAFSPFKRSTGQRRFARSMAEPSLSSKLAGLERSHSAESSMGSTRAARSVLAAAAGGPIHRLRNGQDR